MRTPTRLTTIIAAGALAAGVGATAVAMAGNQGNGRGDMGRRSGAGMMNGSGPGMEAGMGRQAGMSRHAGQTRRGDCRLPTRTNAAPLSAGEVSAVTYMREEEKLARDVYGTLADTSGNPVFTRIAASEQRHMDALGRVITRYHLPDPVTGKAVGQFENPTLQRLYDALIAKGGTSPAAALEVGRSIEKLDIADLQERQATLKHADVRWVFGQLERGSNMHLRAFTMQAG